MAITNECNHIVTLGYLRSFVGNLIQDDNGHTVSVNMHGKDETYCPTYSDLASGYYIQVREKTEQPSNDTDGIYISGTYSSKQLVMQSDLIVEYTRFNEIIASANTYNISECGGQSNLDYTLSFNRYTKSLNSSCSSSSSVVVVYDTTAEWNNPTYGRITGSIYSIDKNGTISADSRTDNIVINKSFKGESHQAEINIRQNELTGNYSWQNQRTGSTTPTYSNFIVSPTIFGCEGGPVSGTRKKNYQTYHINEWKDSCGTIYTSITSADTYESHSETENWGGSTVSPFDCSTETSPKTITLTWGNLSAIVTQTCTCCTCDDLTLNPTSLVWEASSYDSRQILIESKSCITNISISVTLGETHFTASLDDDVIVVRPNGPNTDTTAIYGAITVTYNSNGSQCSKIINLSHSGSACDCSKLTFN